MPLGIAAEYRPRNAEQGVLYRVIDEHLETFLDAAAQHSDGSRLPAFVEQEFRDFLACGVLEREPVDDGGVRWGLPRDNNGLVKEAAPRVERPGGGFPSSGIVPMLVQ